MIETPFRPQTQHVSRDTCQDRNKDLPHLPKQGERLSSCFWDAALKVPEWKTPKWTNLAFSHLWSHFLLTACNVAAKVWILCIKDRALWGWRHDLGSFPCSCQPAIKDDFLFGLESVHVTVSGGFTSQWNNLLFWEKTLLGSPGCPLTLMYLSQLLKGWDYIHSYTTVIG